MLLTKLNELVTQYINQVASQATDAPALMSDWSLGFFSQAISKIYFEVKAWIVGTIDTYMLKTSLSGEARLALHLPS